MDEIYIVPNHSGPTVAVEIDEDLCIGCNSCADICRIQTILPNPEKGKPPVVAYPEECWYCGCCVEACMSGALKMRLPIGQRLLFKDKASGQIFRLGADDAPEKSYFRPPYGWLERPALDQIIRLLADKDKETVIILSDECGTKIGRFFGEKEQRDNTEKLKKFLHKAGFSDIICKSDTNQTGTDKYIITADCEAENEYLHISVAELAALLKRICVSSSTAVCVWNSL